jgi:hypothetical protein
MICKKGARADDFVFQGGAEFKVVNCLWAPAVRPTAFGHLRCGQLPSAGPRQKEGAL